MKLFFLALTLLFAPPFQAFSESRLIHIAANLPLTGELGLYGQEIRDGAAIALDDVGGAKERLQFTWDDNKGELPTTQAIMRRHLTRPVDIYISGLTPQIMVIEREISKRAIPNFVWEWSADINEQSSNNFRTWVNFGAEVGILKNYAAHRHLGKTSISYVQLPHTEKLYNQTVSPFLKRLGADEIFLQPFDLNERNFQALILQVKSHTPDTIFLCGFVNQVTELVRVLRQYKLLKDKNVYVSMDLLDATSLLTPSELEGLIVTVPSFLVHPSKKYLQWKKRFQERYGREPTYHAAYAYDMALIIIEATKDVETKSDTKDLMHRIKSARITGVTGDLKFDDRGSLVIRLESAQFLNGKLSPLELDKQYGLR